RWSDAAAQLRSPSASTSSRSPLPGRSRSTEIILMEMEAHEDAWPFLEPVNPRLVPGYRRIIKNPMDLGTMRTRLLRGGYSCPSQFASDALLVFDNCRTFNEDESAVGRAGRSLRRFFESRWGFFLYFKLLFSN
uniref:Uncharacterized protein n=1 Tax=Melopsittacus undulatus TaxID=13146 RepID=A0A8V5GLN1_MELUD